MTLGALFITREASLRLYRYMPRRYFALTAWPPHGLSSSGLERVWENLLHTGRARIVAPFSTASV